MLFESYIIPPSSQYPLFITAKRYWLKEFEDHAEDPLAKTLIVLHSTSFYKEVWEPTLDDMFNLTIRDNTSKVVLREAWAIDCPNHGEAGILNRSALKEEPFISCPISCENYSRAVHQFLSAGPSHVDFHKRNLIGIGHSLGANAILMLQRFEPIFPFSLFVIIEPMISSEGFHHLRQLRDSLVIKAERRRNFWVGRDEAKNTFLSIKNVSASWELRVLDSLLTYGLYWDKEAKGYRLCCSPEQEIVMYLDEDGAVLPVQDLNKICHILPVHLIVGGISDFIPSHVTQSLVAPMSGRRFASLTTIENVGHLIPQVVPETLAIHIFNALSSDTPSYRTSRL